MNRRFTDTTLIIASHNRGKVREITDLLTPFGIAVVAADDLHLAEPEETEPSFTGNALLKARAAARAAHLPALADDSGLVVPALDGAPGIYSARWAGPDKDFTRAMQQVADELGVKDPAAHFVCALALVWPDGEEAVFEGKVFGHLEFPPRGDRGFGYDPIFVPEGHTMTFGEMDPDAKHAMSHRAEAFRHLVEACFG